MARYNLGNVVGPQGDPGETGNGIASTVLNQDYSLTINYTNGDSDTTTSIRGEKGETGATGKDGKDYVITQADYEAIADVVESEVNIPTKTSQLTNDSGFVTNLVNDLANYYLKSNTYTKDEVNTLIGNIETISMTVVSELPSEGESNIIYLVPSADPQTQNVKDEYIWVNNGWEQIGSTAIDLSDYQTKIDSTHKLDADLVDDTSSTNKFVTASDKTAWSGKYDLPSGGIPSTDLSSAVQTSLGKADSAVQDVSGKEDKTNKVTSLSSSSTDVQYPSAKAVYDAIQAGGSVKTYTWDGEYTGNETMLQEIYNSINNNELVLVKCTKLISHTVYMVTSQQASYSVYPVYYGIKTNDKVYLMAISYQDGEENMNKSIANYVIQSKVIFTVSNGTVTGTTIKNLSYYVLPANSRVEKYGAGRFGSDSSSVLTTQNQSVYTPTGDYNPATKKYVDDSASTKQDTLVSGTNIKTINNESLLGNGNINFEFGNLDYKGHVETVDDLPSIGQPSATVVTPNIVISEGASILSTNSTARDTLAQTVTASYPYYVGVYSNNTGFYSNCSIITNDENCLGEFTYVTNSGYQIFGIKVNYIQNKTVTIKNLNASRSMLFTYDDGFSAGSTNYYHTVSPNSNWTVDGSGWLFVSIISEDSIGGYENGKVDVFSNISNYKFVEFPYNGGTIWYLDNRGGQVESVKTMTNHLNYTYADDYGFVTFDSTTNFPSYVGATPSPDAVENAVYTVGDTYEIYRCNSQPAWEHWSESSGGSSTDVQINGTSIVSSGTANIITETAYDASTNKIATMSDLPTITPIYLGKTSTHNTEQTAIDLNALPIGMYYLKQDSNNNKLWIKATYKGNQQSATTRTLEIDLFEDTTAQGKPNVRVVNNQIILYKDKAFDETTTSKTSMGSITTTLQDDSHALSVNFRMINLTTTGITLANHNYENFALESTNNKVTSLSSASTNTQYPSAKAVYDALNSDLLHYKGHVSSVDDLPSTGQESSSVITPNITIPSSNSAINNNAEDKDVLKAFTTASLPYYFGAYNDIDNYKKKPVIVTDDPSTIDGITYFQFPQATQELYYGIAVHLTYKPTATTRIYPRVAMESDFTYEDGSAHAINSGQYWDIDGSGWMYITTLNTIYTGYDNGKADFYSNIGSIKFVEYPLTSMMVFMNQQSNLTGCKTITNDLDYTYANNYYMYEFDETTDFPSYVGATPSPDAVENNVYTVGSNYEIYRCNSTPAWELWSASDTTGLEDTSNKVTSISASSTDTQYPSAKCVYDAIQNAGGGGSTDVYELDLDVVLSSLQPEYRVIDYNTFNDNSAVKNALSEILTDANSKGLIYFEVYVNHRTGGDLKRTKFIANRITFEQNSTNYEFVGMYFGPSMWDGMDTPGLPCNYGRIVIGQTDMTWSQGVCTVQDINEAEFQYFYLAEGTW